MRLKLSMIHYINMIILVVGILLRNRDLKRKYLARKGKCDV